MSDFYTAEQICSILSGTLIGKADKPVAVKKLCIDSRKISFAHESVFFALKKEKRDGHQYIPEAYKKGVRCFVVEQKISNNSFSDANFILVSSTLSALQSLTAHHRQKFNLPILAITGSNGKTIVKEWLYQILNKTQKVVRSPKSYNSQVGVPLSVWEISEEHTFGIFEAGISKPGEMANLAKIIQPTLGLITNIGEAHQENFLSKKQKCIEKLRLFESCETLVYCKDDSIISECIQENQNLSSTRLFSWSTKTNADLLIEKVAHKDQKTFLNLKFKGKNTPLSVPFEDPASLQNIGHCIAALLAIHVSLETICSEIPLLSSVNMRLDLKQGVNGCTIINDYYNSDLTSFSIALDFLESQKKHLKTTVILSDILESGKQPEDLYKIIAELLAEKRIQRLIGIGKQISAYSSLFPSNSLFFPSTSAFLEAFDIALFEEESILLKGSRVFEFEKISALIQKKVHDTVLEINLGAIQDNLNYYRSLLNDTTKIMVMVKALSYGSGTYEIAKLLAFNKVGYLGVAYVDEGIALRNAGVKTPIMVMNPDRNSYDVLFENNLEPEVYSFKSFNETNAAAKRYFHKTGEAAKIHVKVDTGMHRLGFDVNELGDLIEKINSAPWLHVSSVLSHLATSDDPKMEQFTKKQFDLFDQARSTVLSSLQQNPPLFHILNSAGIAAYPEKQHDMVRLGIGLYGVSSDKNIQKHLAPCSELKTTISQIRPIKKGDAVGYSRTFIAPKDMQIATIPIGYADGFRRSLSNGVGKVRVGNNFAPVVGNVCMDMTMIDITNLPVFEGQEVLVFGKGLSVQEFAESMKTIPYEALTGISDRVKRVFFQD